MIFSFKTKKDKQIEELQKVISFQNIQIKELNDQINNGPFDMRRIWRMLVDIPKRELELTPTLIRDCNDLVKMDSFQFVFDVMIKEALQSSIDNCVDNEHFKIYMTTVLAMQKLRERFRVISEQKAEEEEAYSPYSPI